jgi:23S rRNA (uracil1939-C5)-methyltransferase
MGKNLIELTLTTLTYGGEAMGRHEGRAVFVPFALPGETVRAEIVEEKRGFIRAQLVEALVPSPQRIAPRCPHFGACGGCHYQHMSYADQLEAKTVILRDQLQRIGKIGNPPVKPAVGSPREWDYRNHVQFHVDERGKLGFIGSDPVRGLVPIKECHLPEPAIGGLWPGLEFEPGAPVTRLSIRAGIGEDLMLVLESDDPQTPEMEIEADVSIVHLYEEHPAVIAGSDHLFIEVLGREFRVSAGSFFQVNTAMAEKMVNHLLENLPVTATSHLLDLYCGVGLFSAFFAPRVAHVTGIELSLPACDDFVFNLDEFENVDLYEAPVEAVLPGLDLHPDTILVDPPRAGLERSALDAIVTSGAGVVAYVSCDPSTLARDAARLIQGGYTLESVTPFDLFPQTYHIESISIFKK